MQPSHLIQILVFTGAGIIVVIFILGGFHFVRTVYRNQLLLERQRHARTLANHAAQAVRRDQALLVPPDLKQRDGYYIEQPDGFHELAVRIESQDSLFNNPLRGSEKYEADPDDPSTSSSRGTEPPQEPQQASSSGTDQANTNMEAQSTDQANHVTGVPAVPESALQQPGQPSDQIERSEIGRDTESGSEINSFGRDSDPQVSSPTGAEEDSGQASANRRLEEGVLSVAASEEPQSRQPRGRVSRGGSKVLKWFMKMS